VIDSWVLAMPRDLLSARLAKDTAFAARWYRSIAMFLADRLRASVQRLGYGESRQDMSTDELADSTLDDISLAAIRFDKVVRKLQGEYKAVPESSQRSSDGEDRSCA
jgi:CRP/FNR family cyclic AMP-dependent transcriptional regulator